MFLHKKLFLSDKIENKEEIITLLENNTPIFDLYMICVCKKSNNMFDIISSREYFKEINKDKNYIIVGLAIGENDSFELLKNIFIWWLIDKGRKNVDGLKNYFI